MRQTAGYLLWCSQPVLQCATLVLLMRDGLARKHRIFALFLLAQVVSFAVLLPLYLRGSYATYATVYWAFAALDTALTLFVLQELFFLAFEPLAGIRDVGRVIFRWAAWILLLLVAVMQLGSLREAADWPLTLPSALLALARGVTVMQVGLVLLFSSIASYVGLSYRSRIYGTALGFVFASSVDLAVSLLTGRVHCDRLLLTWLANGGNVAAAGLWLGYFAQRAPKAVPVQLPAGSPLRRWNEIALALGPHGRRAELHEEGHLSGIERIVERVLQKHADRRH